MTFTHVSSIIHDRSFPRLALLRRSDLLAYTSWHSALGNLEC